VKRNAKRSPQGSSSGRGSRLHLTLLAATVAAFLLVPAAQAFGYGNVKINIAGTGAGKVIAEFEEAPTFIECTYASPGPTAGTCEHEAQEITENVYGATLLAGAAEGSEFTGWTVQEGNIFRKCTADGESALGPYFICFLSAESEESNIEVTAHFNIAPPKLPLTVVKTGEGTVVSSSASGINCGSECEAGFPSGKSVTLTASPATGYAFNSWAGCTTHVGLKCTVEMSKAKTVKASFIATPSLSIEKTGTGAGKVGATGISCDESCSSASSAIKAGTSVTFKVTPAKGSEAAVFEEGTGSAESCSGGTCTFTISEDSSVKVRFDSIPTNTLTVTLTGDAAFKGKVTGKGTLKGLYGSAINCGSGCTLQTESFFSSDTVTLTAVAGTGYTFSRWVGGEEAGTCVETISPCTVSMSKSQTIAAEFR